MTQLEAPPLANGSRRDIVAARVEWGDGSEKQFYGAQIFAPFHIYVGSVATNQYSVYVSERAYEYQAGAGWQRLVREWPVYTNKVVTLLPSPYGGSISGLVAWPMICHPNSTIPLRPS